MLGLWHGANWTFVLWGALHSTYLCMERLLRGKWRANPHWFLRNTSVLQVAQKQKWWLVGTVWGFMLILLSLSQKSSDSFIYFQF